MILIIYYGAVVGSAIGLLSSLLQLGDFGGIFFMLDLSEKDH